MPEERIPCPHRHLYWRLVVTTLLTQRCVWPQRTLCERTSAAHAASTLDQMWMLAKVPT
eukprot:SAG11_NODE_21145_length_431_cov_0.906627_1_plen_58_part_10